MRPTCSYRRAFSMAIAACAARVMIAFSSSALNSSAPIFCEVEVPDGPPAPDDRHAEEAAHQRMIPGEPDEGGVVDDRAEADRTLLVLQQAEEAAATRQRTDAVARFLRDPRREELHDLAVLVEDPERGVPRFRDLTGQVDDLLQHRRALELRGEREAGLVEGLELITPVIERFSELRLAAGLVRRAHLQVREAVEDDVRECEDADDADHEHDDVREPPGEDRLEHVVVERDERAEEERREHEGGDLELAREAAATDPHTLMFSGNTRGAARAAPLGRARRRVR